MPPSSGWSACAWPSGRVSSSLTSTKTARGSKTIWAIFPDISARTGPRTWSAPTGGSTTWTATGSSAWRTSARATTSPSSTALRWPTSFRTSSTRPGTGPAPGSGIRARSLRGWARRRPCRRSRRWKDARRRGPISSASTRPRSWSSRSTACGGCRSARSRPAARGCSPGCASRRRSRGSLPSGPSSPTTSPAPTHRTPRTTAPPRCSSGASPRPTPRPGRFSHREAGVHAVDNWILDRVLDAPQREDRMTDNTLPA